MAEDAPHLDLTTLGSDSSHSAAAFGHGQFAPGTVLAARYRIVGLLGRGGMGEVYRADDLTLGQSVAIKLLPERFDRDTAALSRLLEEVRTARQVSHPNVCRVHDVGEASGRRFLSMEYIDGEDLSVLLRRIGRLPQDKGTEIARQLCAGLAAAHDRGVLHRDLKPANIMIDGRGRVRITDFGLATALATAGRDGEVAGTPAYMAPEQLDGKPLTIQSDLYALGLVLYELFTGKRFHEVKSIAELRDRHAQGVSGSMSTSSALLEPAISRVIERCLETDAHRRPSSAIQVAAALPGGDPLAAAIAAGETPSPEMVAAAGDRGGLTVRAAALWCAVFVAGVVACLILTEPWSHARLLGLSRSPDALIEHAHITLEHLGFSERGAASASGFESRKEQIDAALANPGSNVRAVLRSQSPSAAFFWYREDASTLVVPEHAFFGSPFAPFPMLRSTMPVTPALPPRTDGTRYLELTPQGQLESFEARMTPGSQTSSTHHAFEWATAFNEAGLDITAFEPAAPKPLPMGAFDTRVAWAERDRTAGKRVEAAALAGLPVYFRVMTANTPAEFPRQPLGDWPLPVWILLNAIVSATIITTIALTRVNLARGRGDRAGAARVALFVGGTSLAATLLTAAMGKYQPLPTIFGALAAAAFMAGFCWVFYLAIEPLARRQWPHTLTGWSRFIRGDWRDPLAGRELLIGGAVGACLNLLLSAPVLVRSDVDTLTMLYSVGPGSLHMAGNLGHALAVGLNQAGGDLLLTSFWVVMLLLAKRIGRREVPAFAVMLIITSIALVGPVDTPKAFALSALIGLVNLTATTLLYRRVGFLALLASNWVTSLIGSMPSVMPTSFTSGSYFAALAWMTVIAAAAPILFGLYTSLAGRSIFGEPDEA